MKLGEGVGGKGRGSQSFLQDEELVFKVAAVSIISQNP